MISCVMVAAACALPGQYDQRGGEAIADRIRAANAPIVEDVLYLEGDFMDPSSVHVTLRLGTPEADAVTFVCAVVLPAIADGDPPDDFSVGLWDGGRVIATHLTPCPQSP